MRGPLGAAADFSTDADLISAELVWKFRRDWRAHRRRRRTVRIHRRSGTHSGRGFVAVWTRPVSRGCRQCHRLRIWLAEAVPSMLIFVRRCRRRRRSRRLSPFRCTCTRPKSINSGESRRVRSATIFASFTSGRVACPCLRRGLPQPCLSRQGVLRHAYYSSWTLWPPISQPIHNVRGEGTSSTDPSWDASGGEWSTFLP